jgi:hypothetical protein
MQSSNTNGYEMNTNSDDIDPFLIGLMMNLSPPTICDIRVIRGLLLTVLAAMHLIRGELR